jgi:hypothetical protein
MVIGFKKMDRCSIALSKLDWWRLLLFVLRNMLPFYFSAFFLFFPVMVYATVCFCADICTQTCIPVTLKCFGTMCILWNKFDLI